MSGVFVDKAGNPSWNLKAETVCFPLTVKQGGKDHVVFFELKVPNSTAVKTALKGAFASQRVVGKEIKFEDGDLTKARDLINELFVKMHAVSVDDVNQHKQFLKNRPDIQELLFTTGFLGVIPWNSDTENIQEDTDVEAEDVFDLEEPEQREIYISKALYDPKKEEVLKLKLTHTMRRVMSSEFLEMKRLERAYANPKDKTVYTVKDWSLIESLYRKLVISLSGYTLDGESCDEDNKADWIGLVPLAHKYMAVQLLFEDTEAKN